MMTISHINYPIVWKERMGGLLRSATVWKYESLVRTYIEKFMFEGSS